MEASMERDIEKERERREVSEYGSVIAAAG